MQSLERATECFQSGDFAQAMKIFREILEDPATPREAHTALLANVGCSLMSLGELRQAVDSFDQALLCNPHHVESLYNKGLALVELNELDLGTRCFSKATVLRPDFTTAWLAHSEALLNLSRYEESEAAARRAVQLDATSPTAQGLLGLALFYQKKYTEANAAFSLANREEIKDAYAQSLMEEAFLKKDESLLVYATQVYPESWELIHNLGVVQVTRGARDEAKKCFETALSLSPDSVSTLVALGSLALEVEDWPLSQKYFAQACEANPTDQVARYNLGVVLAKLGQNAQARIEFNKLPPDDEQAKRALKHLDQLEESKEDTEKWVAHKPRVSSASISQLQQNAKSKRKSTLMESLPAEELQLIEAEELAEVAKSPPREHQAVPAPPQEPEESMNPKEVTIPEEPVNVGSNATYYTYEQLKFPNPCPPGLDPTKKETYLSPEEFSIIFARTPAEFNKLPQWKRTWLKKDKGLF